MQEQLTTGALEITITGVLAIFEPKITLLELPYLFRDRDHIRKGQDSEAVKDLASGLPAKGVRLIGFLENGFRHITNGTRRSEEHTSELQSIMRISYAVFCLKKQTKKHTTHRTK